MPYKDIETRKAYLKEWRLENPDYYKNWIKNHSDYRKNWRKRHSGYTTNRVRIWLKNHPGYMATASKKRYPLVKKSGATKALSKVKYAIKKGRLLSLKNNYILCVDCGKRATQYDHRDYSKPLDVKPVCRSCNLYRGPARPIIEVDNG